MTILLRDHLRARRVAVLVLMAGLMLTAVGYLAMFPSFEDQLVAFADDLPDYFRAMIGDADFSTPEGYIRSEVFALIGPLLSSGVAISVGAGLARADRDRTLTATFLSPVSRRTLALSWLGAVWLVALAAAVAVIIGVALGAPLAGASVGFGAVVAATVPLLAVAAMLGSVSWSVGAVTGSPGAATGAGWGLLGVSFLANSIGEIVTGAHALARFSPWGWYGAGEAISGDLNVAGLAGLLVIAAAAAAAGLVGFERRDLQL